MSAGIAYGVLGVVSALAGVLSLWISKRTGEVHSLWFGKHPENIERIERAYLWVGWAGVGLGAFIAMLGLGSAVSDALKF